MDIGSLERQILEEVDLLASGPVSQEESEKAKKQLLSSYLLSLQTNFFKGLVLGIYQVRAGDWKMAGQIVPRYKDVSPEEIMLVAQKYLRSSNRTVVTLVPARY